MQSGTLERSGHLRRVSVRREKELQAYEARRVPYLREHPYCAVWLNENGVSEETAIRQRGLVQICGRMVAIPRSDDVHHRLKRRHGLLLDERWWLPVSRAAHDHIENHKKWARARGYLLDIHASASVPIVEPEIRQTIPSHSMKTLAPRPAFWSKSIASRIPKSAASEFTPSSGSGTPAAPESPPPNRQWLQVLSEHEKVLPILGLSSLTVIPSTPAELIQVLKADDAADATVDHDEFARGIRRAVRLKIAFVAGLHRLAHRRWKAWVAEEFEAGYESYQRYRIAAELQIGLAARGLPRLTSCSQVRIMAPFRAKEKFWEALATISYVDSLPAGAALRERLVGTLGLPHQRAAGSLTQRLAQTLSRITKEYEGSAADPVIAEAIRTINATIVNLRSDRELAA